MLKQGKVSMIALEQLAFVISNSATLCRERSELTLAVVDKRGEGLEANFRVVCPHEESS